MTLRQEVVALMGYDPMKNGRPIAVIPATRLIVITEMSILRAQTIINDAFRMSKCGVSFHDDRPRYISAITRGRDQYYRNKEKNKQQQEKQK